MKLLQLTRRETFPDGSEVSYDHFVVPGHIMFFHEAFDLKSKAKLPGARVWFVGGAFMDVDQTVAELRDMLEGVVP